MSQIKSLADELRETIKKDGHPDKEIEDGKSAVKQTPINKLTKKPPDAKLDTLFESILAFELTGREKLLIRLDDRTVFLLKQLKIAKAIDMNKLIAFSLQHFLRTHPELIEYVKENIKTIKL
ncbi:hypothetical protein AY601_2923 [Pedobacter cryoconitis]|uniref:Uncharacterized protein n=1 Tax=Pedobacter cryoconitis TaxID=188932 RepID=A0A127VFV0_9SPHI|nr:hypothetical protein [Pedobacter cryoconitis]AMP99798.1 hypothetical protein AY601_2923 [Pedobacter cryoconitis]